MRRFPVCILAPLVLLTLGSTPTLGQDVTRYQGPVIDMHMHVSAYYIPLGADGKPLPFGCYPAPCDGIVTAAVDEFEVQRMTVEAMDRHNVVLGFLSGDGARLMRWAADAPGRFLTSPTIGTPGEPTISDLRRDYGAGRLTGMGEITTQYNGFSPNDPAIEPYFALAEELDVPTLVHTLGIGAPTPGFRVSNGDPRFLEEVVVRHPNLRLYVENCGFPFAEEMIAMMYQYPDLHCDISTITWIIHRQAFVDFLERLTRSGLGKRIMFGSDQMLLPETIGIAIESIQELEFLTLEEKADIFYNNAARFLRLSDDEIAQHHNH